MTQSIDRIVAALTAKNFLPMEASGRHVHLTEADAITLFGHTLTPARELSQPGQYLCKELVTLRGPKGTLEHVAVLGPTRRETQAELSMTDARQLGIDAPVRQSGHLQNTPGITICTEKATITTESGTIVAKRHIHMPPDRAELCKLKDGQTVRLRTLSARPLTFEDVVVRVHASFAPAVHIDFDEANACGFAKGDLALLLPYDK